MLGLLKPIDYAVVIGVGVVVVALIIALWLQKPGPR